MAPLRFAIPKFLAIKKILKPDAVSPESWQRLLRALFLQR